MKERIIAEGALDVGVTVCIRGPPNNTGINALR
jgi:hypothetical protein